MRKYSTIIIYSVILMMITAYSLGRAAAIPIVYESFTKNTCVKVDDPSGRHDCNNMPEQYYHVWVK